MLVNVRSLLFFGLFVLGFCVRMSVHQQLYEGYPRYYHPPAISDMAIYDAMALEVAAGRVPQKLLYHNPLYYHLLGLSYYLGGDKEAFLMLQILLGSGVGPLLFLIARRYLSLTEAAITGVMGALYKPFLFYDQFLLLESLHSFFFVVLLWVLMISSDRIVTLFTPVMLGIMHLLRLNAPLLWPMVLWGLVNRGISRTRILMIMFLWIPWFLVVPLYHYVHGGVWFFGTSNFGENIYMGNNSDSSGTVDYSPECFRLKAIAESLPLAKQGEFWVSETLKTWDSYWGIPGLFVRKFCLAWGAWELPNNISMQAMEYYSPTLRGFGMISFSFLAPMGLFGLWILLRSRQKARIGFGRYLAGWGLTWTAALTILIVLGRYRLPLGTILCLSSGSGLMAIVRPEGELVKRACLLVLIFFLINVIVNYQAFLGMPLYGFPPTLRY